jgi:peptidoglycan/xylan/chitin deacetylase (PgdA/CDA1 family)
VSALTIVMYHYVRDLPRTRYPRIKGRTIEEFEQQLDHIEGEYTVTTTRAVIESMRPGGRPLPPKACLLTFDDGFIDHYAVVFPLLVARGLSASFYPPAMAVHGERVLDVHKIQFTLAVTEARDPGHEVLKADVLRRIDPYRRDVRILSNAELEAKYLESSPVGDLPATAFIKRVLQKGLPRAVRGEIVRALFDEHVGVADAVFSHELYMDVAQLRTMVQSGMEVGGHGAEHLWFDELGVEEARAEVSGTCDFLAEVYGKPPVDWVMCYPYGCHTSTALACIEQAGGVLGLTTQVGVVRDLSSPLLLPRLDTNDLPPYRAGRPQPSTMAHTRSQEVARS